jgi:hypothetical protein
MSVPQGSSTRISGAILAASPHYVDPHTGRPGSAGLLGQFPDELARDARVRNDDDRILACAAYWVAELPRVDSVREAQLRRRGYLGRPMANGGAVHACLLTADENVKAKASLSHGLWANSASAFLLHLRHTRAEAVRASHAAHVAHLERARAASATQFHRARAAGAAAVQQAKMHRH